MRRFRANQSVHGGKIYKNVREHAEKVIASTWHASEPTPPRRAARAPPRGVFRTSQQKIMNKKLKKFTSWKENSKLQKFSRLYSQITCACRITAVQYKHESDINDTEHEAVVESKGFNTYILLYM